MNTAIAKKKTGKAPGLTRFVLMRRAKQDYCGGCDDPCGFVLEPELLPVLLPEELGLELVLPLLLGVLLVELSDEVDDFL